MWCCAAANRKLGAAWIEYLPEPKTLTSASLVLPFGAYDLTSLLSLSAASNAVWGRVNAVLDEGSRSFTVRFLPRVSGVYALHFEDETGLGNNRLFDLRLATTCATVRMDRPSKSRDVLNVLLNAELPLQITAEDPLYGLRSVFLEYRTQLDQPPQQLLLQDAASAVQTVLAPFAGTAAAGAAPRLRPTHLEFRRMLALASLRRPDGGSLRVGDVVTLQACADDWDDVSPFKEPGRSSAVEIRIIDSDEFDLTLNQEQADVQQKLLRLREKERDAEHHTEEAERRLLRVEKMQPKEDDSSGGGEETARRDRKTPK